MVHCWLQSAKGDALHAVLCAAGYNLRWLSRAIVQRKIRAFLCACLWGGAGHGKRVGAWMARGNGISAAANGEVGACVNYTGPSKYWAALDIRCQQAARYSVA